MGVGPKMIFEGIVGVLGTLPVFVHDSGGVLLDSDSVLVMLLEDDPPLKT